MDEITTREAAYRSLTDPLSFADAARELGVSEKDISLFVQEGRLKSLHGQHISGNALADFLQASTIPVQRQK